MSKNIAVIGGGPGGYAAAFLAADLGMQVTLIDERENPGGVCLYVGCIPSKALLHVAALVNEADHAKAWGIEYGQPKIDLDRLRGFKDSVVKKLTGGLGQLAKQRKVTYLRGRAEFVNSNTLKVALVAGGEQTLSFDNIVIATGSRPATVPAFQINSPRILDSTGGLALQNIPKSLARRRRRLHRAGTWNCLCIARDESVRRRDAAGLVAGRRSRPGESAGEAD